jgi:3-oxoacyl-[acyl-carrier-protein] synthase III
MTSELYINQAIHFIPEEKLKISDFDTESLDGFFNTKEEFINSCDTYLQLQSIRVAPEKSLEDMMTDLLDKGLDTGIIDPSQIDHIIISPIYNANLEGYGHFLQHEFEMKNANIIRSGDHYCANIDLSLELARRLMSQDKKENVLVVGGSKFADLRQRLVGSYAVAGDSASYMLLTNKKDEHAKLKLIAQAHVIKGQLNDVDLSEDNTILHYQAYLLCMRKIFSNPAVAKEKIAKIVCHNANITLVKEILKTQKFDPSIIFLDNQGKYGHLGTTDLVLNLNDCQESLKSGELLMSISLGVIGTYVATIYEKI